MDKYTIRTIEGREVTGFAHPVTDIGCTSPRGWNVLVGMAGWVYFADYRIDAVEMVAA